MRSELEALSFAGRKRIGRLAELQIIEANINELLELGLHFCLPAKEVEGLAGGHRQTISNAFVAIFDSQNLLTISRTAALAAFHEDVGHELHIDLNVAFALAGAATAVVDIEAEMAGRVVMRSGFKRFGKHLAN